MERRPIFTKDIWSGAFYDLAIELGPMSDERLRKAAFALWKHKSLAGPYADSDREPWLQERASPSLILAERGPRPALHVFGVATLPDGTEIAVGNLAIREGRYRGPGRPRQTDKPDWLVLYIPVAALAAHYGWDAVEDNNWPEWKTLDDWFADIGRTVYDAVPFALGLVGEAASTATDAETVKAALPKRPPIAMLLPNDSGGVDWYPLEETLGQIIRLPKRP